MVLKLTNPALRLQSITANDEESLCEIYSSTRTEELARLTDWTATQKQIFLRSQFAAQHAYYQNNYKGAHFWLIEYKGEAIGRLYLHFKYEDESIRIIDISLLPRWRNRGFGKEILKDVLAFANKLERTVTIHVESFNRAMRLYERLGFNLLSQTNGVYHLLEWKPRQDALNKNQFTQRFSSQWQ
jgi:RimJ/RimL family protein N-acetyltransferase